MFNFLSTSTKLRILLITNHLLAFSIFFLNDISWYYWIITFFSVVIIGKIGGEIGFHRYFAHRTFETAKWKERCLLILGSLNMVGSTLSWAGTHRVHHTFADKPEDPHSPYQQHWLKIWLLLWKPFVIKTKQVSDMIKDPWQTFIHRYYFELCLATLIIVGFINFPLMVFGLVLPSIIQFHVGSLLIDIVCHKWGYRSFNTTDHSRNNTWVNIFTGGSGLHNNHHAKPHLYYYALKKGEWDLPGLFIRHFLVKK